MFDRRRGRQLGQPAHLLQRWRCRTCRGWGQGWTDHPLGIVGDSDNPENNWKVEYMSQHIKDDAGNWGEFTDPVLWASWGEDGNDGHFKDVKFFL